MAAAGDLCQVEAYSGASCPESPRHVTWRGVRYEIRIVEQSRRSPDSLHFTVQVSTGERFLLTYHQTADFWTAEIL